MKTKNIFFIALRILFFLTGLILIRYSISFPMDLEKYYPLEQGNKWIYVTREGTSEKIFHIKGNEIINGTNTVKIAENKDPDRYDCIAVDVEGVKQYKQNKKDQYVIFNPPMMLFPNLEPSEEKNFTMGVDIYKSDGTKYTTDITEQISLESSVEDIIVPAGAFNNCLKFSITTNYTALNGNSITKFCSIWLAADIGQVQDICFEVEYNNEKGKQYMSTDSSHSELVSAFVNGKQIGNR
jgi:hypothetical protein